MKLTLLIPTLLLSGCSTFVPVTMNNPYDFPKSLLEECQEPDFISQESKFSDNLKVIIDNNTKATECRVTKKALNELIQQRKEIYEKVSK
jgi:PBP1b-binding outer membrane lipoprotein LpoB